MMPAARVAALHLVEVWRCIPVGTPVVVSGFGDPRTFTASEPRINANGIAVIRVSAWNGLEVALDRVHLAGPQAVAIADAIEPAPVRRESGLGVADFLLSTVGLIGASLVVGWLIACVAVAVTGWVTP